MKATLVLVFPARAAATRANKSMVTDIRINGTGPGSPTSRLSAQGTATTRNSPPTLQAIAPRPVTSDPFWG